MVENTEALINKGDMLYVYTQQITQYFNPNTYIGNGTLSYKQQNYRYQYVASTQNNFQQAVTASQR